MNSLCNYKTKYQKLCFNQAYYNRQTNMYYESAVTLLFQLRVDSLSPNRESTGIGAEQNALFRPAPCRVGPQKTARKNPPFIDRQVVVRISHRQRWLYLCRHPPTLHRLVTSTTNFVLRLCLRRLLMSQAYLSRFRPRIPPPPFPEYKL